MNATSSAPLTLPAICTRLKFLLTAIVLLTLALPAPAETVRIGAGSRSLNDLLDGVANAEKQGTGDRDEVLEAALEKAPDHPAARGLCGFMFYQGQWTPAVTVAQELRRSEDLRQYQMRRGRYPNTPVGQRGLAAWCEAHHLPDQQRAHLSRLLQLAPDDADARAKLGYIRIDGRWVVEENVRRAMEAMRVWRPRLQALYHQLIETQQPGALPDPDSDQALKSWNEIDDSAAIPAMELAFSMGSDPRGARMVVEKLCRMEDAEATISLARHALWIDDVRVYEAAVAELKRRPREHYVPALLACLYTPTAVQAALVSTPDGRLLLRQVLFQEGAESRDVTTVDSLYRFQGSIPFSPVTPQQQVAAAAQVQIAAQNRMRLAVNNRICTILATATGVRLPAAPESWWQWWNDANEIYVEGEKPVETAYYCQEVTVFNPGRLPPRSSARGRGGDDRQKDCLVAGTPVWTEHGPVAIDKIRVGDLMLAQDAKTGELAFKPVLKTTTRRPGIVVKIDSGHGCLQCSGGHRFWVAEKGWVKARSLVVGDALHGAAGAQQVVSAGNGRSLATFNVVVADFHTYFVGPDKLLSHDNTMVDPAQGPLPGVKAR